MIAVFLGWFVLVAVPVVQARLPQETQQQIQQLVKQLANVDFDEREWAEQQLIEIGTPAIDLLVEELIDCKPDVCSRIKRILQTSSEKCDEEALFKVLAVLRLRFEVSDERVKPLLERWASLRRAAVVARWREQGAVVTDPFQKLGRDALVEMLDNRIQVRMAPGRQVFEFLPNGARKVPAQSEPPKEVQRPEEDQTRSNAELLRFVLEGTLEQNKKLVLNSKQGADGFEKQVAMVQKQPVTVTIGEDWKGDYSVFDFDEAKSILPISSLELEKLEINDSLLSALKEHPLSSVVLTECSLAADLKGSLPRSVSVLSISGSAAPADMLRVVSKKSPLLSRIRFEKCKFGEIEALVLRNFSQLATVDLSRIDLEGDTFEGLAEVKQLRLLWLERCKFPAPAFIEFRQKRREVNVEFSAKAFLGVSSDDLRGRMPLRNAACVIATVVPGEAADRAGMEAGDVVVQIGDQKVANFDELRVVIAQYEIGEEATIQVRRDGKELTLKAKMGTPSD